MINADITESMQKQIIKSLIESLYKINMITKSEYKKIVSNI